MKTLIPIFRAASIALFVCLTLTTTTKADTITTFNATGTFRNGATLSGTVTMDTTTGSVTAADLIIGAPTAFDAVDVIRYGSLPSFYFLVQDSAGDYFNAIMPVASVVGYAGGPLCSTSYSPLASCSDGTGIGIVATREVYDLSVGSLSPVTSATPEPATMPLVCSVLVAAGLLRRHILRGKHQTF